MGTKQSRWFAWSPTGDTFVAMLTEPAMIALYWTATHLLNNDLVGALLRLADQSGSQRAFPGVVDRLPSQAALKRVRGSRRI